MFCLALPLRNCCLKFGDVDTQFYFRLTIILDHNIHYTLYIYIIIQAIDRWELIAELVLQREGLLEKLEKFERAASDPNRFFHKEGKKSTYRLEESRKRAYFTKRIDALDVEIKEEVDYIKDTFQDSITFKVRHAIASRKN